MLPGRHHQQCRSSKKVYLGLSENHFKDRYRNHARDFNNEIHCNKTELSKYVWDLNRKNKRPHVTCTIVSKVYDNPKQNFCRFPNQDILLNNRSEFNSKCRHEIKNLIMNVK